MFGSYVDRHIESVGVDPNREKLTGGKFFIDLGDSYAPVRPTVK